jgi:hypothetical protein
LMLCYINLEKTWEITVHFESGTAEGTWKNNGVGG